jgi:hypothetical protein
MAYNNVAKRNSVTVDSTTPIKIFDTNTATRIGWRVVLPTTITAGGGVRFQVQTAGSTAPTKADMLLGCSARGEAGALVVDGASSSLDIYAVLESGASITLKGEEILS